MEELNTRRKWWLENKDDPRIREGFRASSKKYYEKNLESERARGREKYRLKKLAQQGVVAPPAPPVE